MTYIFHLTSFDLAGMYSIQSNRYNVMTKFTHVTAKEYLCIGLNEKKKDYDLSAYKSNLII